MKKTLISCLVLLGALVLASPVLASPADTLQPASTITYNEEVTVNNTLRANTVQIGSTAAGVGGVTYFNGSIVNAALDEDGNNTVAVTIADDLRVDGEIYRTEAGGDNPLKLADTIIPVANNTYSLGSSSYKFKNGYFSGSLAAGSVTSSGSVTADDITASGSVMAGSIVTSGTVDGVDVSTIPSTYVSKSSPSWDERTGYASITPGSCIPIEDTTDYNFPLSLGGSALSPNASGTYYCSVQLPHGATISSMKAYVKDSGASMVTASLFRSDLASYTYENLGTQSTSDASGNQVININSLSETVDSSTDGYFVKIYFSGTGEDYNFRGAIVEYTYTEPY